jgi:alpha-galactosidase
LWVPLQSTGAVTLGRDSDYAWRSTISSTVTFGLFGNGDAAQPRPPPADFPFAKAKAALSQYRSLQPYFLGDYYPLTPYTKAADAWLGWQFHRADLGGGLVQVFRRPECPQEKVCLKLFGLGPRARYVVNDLDDAKPYERSGRELMATGLLLTLPEKPSARIVTYHKTP